jgi:hypothetical protein
MLLNILLNVFIYTIPTYKNTKGINKVVIIKKIIEIPSIPSVKFKFKAGNQKNLYYKLKRTYRFIKTTPD